MAASTDSGVTQNADRTTLSRYDLVLAVIPMAFVAAFVANVVFSLPLRTVLPVSSLVGVLALIDSLYLNPPTNGTP
jgi:hypothetical protein